MRARVLPGAVDHAGAPNGDLEGLAERCAAHRDRLLARLTSYCGDREVAEDITQDTLVAALRAGDELRDVRHLWAWLWRVAVNRTHSHYRRRAVEQRVLPRVATDVASHGHEDAVAARLLLDDVGDRCGDALRLRFLLGCSVAETATALGCAPGTVKSLTHRGAARLRQRVAV